MDFWWTDDTTPFFLFVFLFIQFSHSILFSMIVDFGSFLICVCLYVCVCLFFIYVCVSMSMFVEYMYYADHLVSVFIHNIKLCSVRFVCLFRSGWICWWCLFLLFVSFRFCIDSCLYLFACLFIFFYSFSFVEGKISFTFHRQYEFVCRVDFTLLFYFVCVCVCELTFVVVFFCFVLASLFEFFAVGKT